MKITNRISNPLTIIAIFAVITEVAGTVVLPFVTDSLQSVFIWYVMGFPVVLVLLFFITLNFNNKALYAPSDFDNEQNFMDLQNSIMKAISLNEVGEKIQQVKENNPEISEKLEPIENSFQKAIEQPPNEPEIIKNIKIILLSMGRNDFQSMISINKGAGISLAATKEALNMLVENNIVICKQEDDQLKYKLNPDLYIKKH